MKKILIYSLIIIIAGCATKPSPDQNSQKPVDTTTAEVFSPSPSISPPPTPTPSDAIKDNRITAKVTKVVDGDTIEVKIGDKTETIRMILVDTPETKKPNTPVQPFGPEASAFTKETLDGKEVKLERDVSTTDKYGRSLYYVWIGDKMFNEVLLEKGLARVAVFPPDVKYVDRFREIQMKAQRASIGIWSIENYVTDKGYDDKVAESTKPTEAPKPSVKPTETPKATTAPKAEVYYSNCTDAKAHGAYNIHRGEPGYRPALDRDNDGVACEK